MNLKKLTTKEAERIITGTVIPVSTGTLTVKDRLKGKEAVYIVELKNEKFPQYDNPRIEMTEKEVKRLMKHCL